MADNDQPKRKRRGPAGSVSDADAPETPEAPEEAPVAD